MKYLDNSSLKINKYCNITPFGHVQRLFAHLCGRQNLTLSDVCQLYLPQQEASIMAKRRHRNVWLVPEMQGCNGKAQINLSPEMDQGYFLICYYLGQVTMQ